MAYVAGIVPQRGQALYTATKHRVIGMTKSAALDYAHYVITVNAICPGYTRTSIFGNAPEQALFLASDMARYISGAAIPVDGALAVGHQNVSTWKHPEIREKKSQEGQSCIAYGKNMIPYNKNVTLDLRPLLFTTLCVLK